MLLFSQRRQLWTSCWRCSQLINDVSQAAIIIYIYFMKHNFQSNAQHSVENQVTCESLTINIIMCLIVTASQLQNCGFLNIVDLSLIRQGTVLLNN